MRTQCVCVCGGGGGVARCKKKLVNFPDTGKLPYSEAKLLVVN